MVKLGLIDYTGKQFLKKQERPDPYVKKTLWIILDLYAGMNR